MRAYFFENILDICQQSWNTYFGISDVTNLESIYTLGKKGCYTPIEDNKTNVDRTFVFPLGWNWHDMDPWLFPNKIRHYLGQTFNARSIWIVELRNHSIGGRSPKSIFTLWQLWINICIFFQKFFWLFEQCPVQPLWVLGMRCLHLPVRAFSKVLLLPVWVWLVLPSTAYSKGMLPLDLWCQASLQGLPERQHLGKTVHCWGWSDRIVSWVLGPWRRGWEICTEWRLVAQRLTTDSCPVVTGHIDPQRSPCWLPTTVVCAWSGRRGGGTWQWPTGSMSSSVMSRDSNFTRSMAGLGYAIYLVSASGQGARLIGSKLVVVPSTYRELSTIAPNPLLCSLTDISPLCSIGAFCKTP